ncbi:MAG: GTPase [Betaproteobacteria bacterium]|jgi:predicted GTPase
MARRVLILGAAGRDFHDFAMLCRDDPDVEVVAFTATQIPGIDRRRFPAVLAGPRYPRGIPIFPEADLETLCQSLEVDEVLFAYSDVTHAHVMHLASRALACGASFALPGPRSTMISAARPVVAVSAVRTGCGKSQVARWAAREIAAAGLRVAVIRHPMPYGDLARQRVQRLASRADLDAALCTIEEREEYEPHIAAGHVVFAGVDYRAIVAAAEAEADVLLWDGGNNDFPFITPDIHLVLVDALRPGQVTSHHPGEANLRMADAVIVTKTNAASAQALAEVAAALRAVRPGCPVFPGASRLGTDPPGVALQGRRVLVVEDGPSLTHGGLATGAGYAVATQAGAHVLDPRPFAPPTFAAVYAAHPHIGPVIPAVGYDGPQREALRDLIARAAPDLVIAGTPADLRTLLDLEVTVVRVTCEFEPPDASLSGWLGQQLARVRARETTARTPPATR